MSAVLFRAGPLRGRGRRSASLRAARVRVVVVLLLLVAGGMIGLPPTEVRAEPLQVPLEFVNISATSDLSFVPDSFAVAPGAMVRLAVTQLADFDHTFTLSPVANLTISPSSTPAQLAAFFEAHPPIVNLNLGSTPGERYFANFTAPSTLGAYEFVCTIHFPSMTGVMTVASTPSSSGGGSSPNNLEVIVIGAVVALVVILGGLAVWLRARRRGRSGGSSPPAS